MAFSEQITSLQNETVKHLAKLARDTSLRRKEGLFLTEGEKLTRQAVLAGCRFEMLLTTGKEFPFADKAKRQILLSPHCAEKISTMPSAPDCIGLFSMPEYDAALFENPGRFLALEGVQDPGNVGTILRTALAFGADGVIADGCCGDLFSPKALRASMGAALHLPLLQTENLSKTLAEKKKQNRLFVTALREDAISLPTVSVPDHFILVIGNEGHGVSDATLSLADETVIIPMNGKIQSLNASSAASVALYEFFVRKGATI